MHAKKIQTTFGRKIFEKGFIPERGHLGSFWYVTETCCTSAKKQALLVNHGCDFARKMKHPSTITLLFPAHGLTSNTPTS